MLSRSVHSSEEQQMCRMCWCALYGVKTIVSILQALGPKCNLQLLPLLLIINSTGDIHARTTKNTIWESVRLKSWNSIIVAAQMTTRGRLSVCATASG